MRDKYVSASGGQTHTRLSVPLESLLIAMEAKQYKKNSEEEHHP